jgi:hypothetical protein
MAHCENPQEIPHRERESFTYLMILFRRQLYFNDYVPSNFAVNDARQRHINTTLTQRKTDLRSSEDYCLTNTKAANGSREYIIIILLFP